MELSEYLGGDPLEAQERDDALTQGAMTVSQEGRWILAPSHLSEDGGSFTWENVVLLLDEERYIIKPQVTWMPEDWEATIGFAVLFYVFFAGACAVETIQSTVSLWIRGGIAALYCALLTLEIYAEISEKEWTRLQKWQLFVQWGMVRVVLLAPLVFLNHLDWR